MANPRLKSKANPTISIHRTNLSMLLTLIHVFKLFNVKFVTLKEPIDSVSKA